MQDTLHAGTHVALLVKLNMRGARIAPGHRRVAPEDFGIVLEDPKVAPGDFRIAPGDFNIALEDRRTVPEGMSRTARSPLMTSASHLKTSESTWLC